MVAVVLALIAALAVPAQSGVVPCPDAHVIGARGSGQPPGFGEQAAPVVESVVDTLESRGQDVTTAPLDYPAISVSDSFGLVLLTGAYDQSVRAGAIELIARLAQFGRECPTTEIVLVGYSQGAQAIKTALADLPPRYRIAGVILLADPTRDRSQLGIARLGDPTLERSGSFGAIGLPDHFRAIAIDVCAAGDSVCDRSRSSLVAHVEGYVDAPEWVIPILEAELDDRRSNALALR